VVAPVAGFAAGIAVEQMQPIIARTVARLQAVATGSRTSLDIAAERKLHELRQRAERLARLAESNRPAAVAAGDSIDESSSSSRAAASTEDAQLSFTVKTAETIISLAEDYAAFAAKYPNWAEAALHVINDATGTVIGFVTGGPAGAIRGAICAEVQAHIIDEVAGAKIAEGMNYAIGKASEGWAEYDHTLTKDQARALGAATVFGIVLAKQAGSTISSAKYVISVASTLRSAKATGGSAVTGQHVHAFDGGKAPGGGGAATTKSTVDKPVYTTKITQVRARTLTPVRVRVTDKGRVRPINDRMPVNYKYAGKVYFDALPKDLKAKYPHGVPFTGTGYPDFSRYALKKVEIGVTGKNWIDFPAADRAAGYVKRPEGHTWHHHHDGKTMVLVPEDIHAVVRHTGGVAITKELGK
jgi:hypothetical protein